MSPVPPSTGGSREPVHEVVARYLDRLTRGEAIDPLEIVTEEPDRAEEILDRLSVFVALGALVSPGGRREEQ